MCSLVVSACFDEGIVVHKRGHLEKHDHLYKKDSPLYEAEIAMFQLLRSLLTRSLRLL